jgi:hypothetical protein
VLLKNIVEEHEENLYVISNREEFEKPENLEKEEAENKLVVDVDASDCCYIEPGESDAESDESDSILVSDGESAELRKYVTEAFIPHVSKSESSTRGEKRVVEGSAGSDSSDEDPG